MELTTRYRSQSSADVDKIRADKEHSERLLEARERIHRQKIKGLEEQVVLMANKEVQSANALSLADCNAEKSAANGNEKSPGLHQQIG